MCSNEDLRELRQIQVLDRTEKCLLLQHRLTAASIQMGCVETSLPAPIPICGGCRRGPKDPSVRVGSPVFLRKRGDHVIGHHSWAYLIVYVLVVH